MKKEKKNRAWVWIVCIIVGVFIGFGLVLAWRANSSREVVTSKTTQTKRNEEPTFQVQLTKQQMNELTNYYLGEYQKKSKVKYTFVLDNEAMIQGTFPLLGHDLTFYLYFEPSVLENGDVQLKAKSMSIGTFRLPMSELMAYREKNFKFPKWVEVQKDQELMVLHLSQFQLKGGMFVGAEKIDVLDDDIRFNVYLPAASKSN